MNRQVEQLVLDRRLEIAIIGSGIAGMTAAALPHPLHNVTVFEANDYIGGHTHTVSVDIAGERHDIDTGFIVFNERTYPNFIRLLDQLGVASKPTSMSFSVHGDRTGIEYNGTSLNGVFAQRRNVVRPSFLRMLADIARFNRQAPALLDTLPEGMTVVEFLDRHHYSSAFADQYLLPMGAAIWSCPVETYGEFPIRFIIEFYANHGLLQLRDRPVWRVVSGGSQRYIDKLSAPFVDRIRLNCPAHSVHRSAEGVDVTSTAGTNASETERFDEVIFACHSDQALEILADADELETSILREFPYSENIAVLHTDSTVLPRRRRAWASWNYHIPFDAQAVNTGRRPTVTYNMNILQGLESQHTFCVTLNEEAKIDPSQILGRWKYSHPIFTVRRERAQQRHAEVIRNRRTSYCGAYWGSGFHEDGVNSALAVCEAFGIGRDDWDVSSRDVGSRDVGSAVSAGSGISRRKESHGEGVDAG